MICDDQLQTAFGLHFLSERRFVELRPVHGVPARLPVRESPAQPPVLLSWGETPAELPVPHQRFGLCQATPDTVLLTVPAVARYLVKRESITITPLAGAGDDVVRLFLFGSAIGALLQLNDILPLHGSAVRIRSGKAAVFCGKSTAGKSTLAAAMGQLGYLMMADDIAAVRFDAQGVPWLYPGLARSKLWGDALGTLGLGRSESARVRHGLDKYLVPQALHPEPERLTDIYEIRPVEQGEVRLAECRGLEKVSLLARHTFRPRFLEAMGRQAPHMQRLGQLAARTQAHELSRPRGKSTLPEMTARLQAQWG